MSAVVEAVRHVENDRGVVGQEVVANLIKNLGKGERSTIGKMGHESCTRVETANGGYDVEYGGRLSRMRCLQRGKKFISVSQT